MCDRIMGKILMIVAALGLVAAGEHHPVNVPAAERGRELVRRAAQPAILVACALIRRRGSDGGLPKSPPITPGRSATATGCTRLLTKTAGCRWVSPGHRGLLGLGQGLGNDCLLCHAGTVAGQTIIGLGNTSLDMQSLYEELAAADGLDPVMPLPLCNVRGTSEASNFAVYLMQFRDTDLQASGAGQVSRSARTSARTSRPGGCSGKRRRSTTSASPTAARSGRSCRSS